MPRRLPWKVGGALACALALAGCSGSGSRNSETVNAEATSSGVRLSPNPANAASRIDVVFDDLWIDQANCRFEWRRNGSVITGAATATLDPSRFSRGDEISVTVFVDDGAGGAARELDASVEVINSPPKITAASLLTASNAGKVEVHATVEAVDPDGDQVSFAYQWFKNGSPIDGATEAVLPAVDLDRGDRIVAQVVASDGQSESPALRTEPVGVENHAPQFSSQPIAPKPSDEMFRYQAMAVDPDNDPLRYELVAGPKGMSIEPEGALVWRLPPVDLRHGEHRVSIRVTDSRGGQAIQEFSLNFDTPETK